MRHRYWYHSFRVHHHRGCYSYLFADIAVAVAVAVVDAVAAVFVDAFGDVAKPLCC